jgi:hypothetical protein
VSTDCGHTLSASGFQYATSYNRQFTVAVYGTYDGQSFAVAGIEQPF